MRIVVNDVAVDKNAGGVFSILSDLYNEVLKYDTSNEWIFILSGKFFKESKNVKIIVRNDLKKSKIKKFLFERYFGRKFINRLKPDVYVSLQNISTFGVKSRHQIVYVHQGIPFVDNKKFSFFKSNESTLAFYQTVVGRLIKKSIALNTPDVIVQTKWMKNAIINQCGISERKITVAHPVILKSKKSYSGDGKKFFYPASGYVYKNHDVIYKAIEKLNKANITNFIVKLTIPQGQLNGSKNVEYLGHISREKVAEMYTRYVLIFPSYIESFGLPLLEAAEQADIILAADTSFAREILEDYSNVYYFGVNDFQKLSSLMSKVIKKQIVSNKEAIKSKKEDTLYSVIMSKINMEN